MDTQLKNQAQTKFDAAIAHLESELSGIRSGRANPGLVDSIKVNVYGQDMPLKSVATVSTPDAKTIQIQPWDQSNLSAVEKALTEQPNLGLTPNNDGRIIRISIPPMSEETRTQLTKVVREKAEGAQVSLRNARHEALNSAKAAEKNKQLTQDQVAKLEKDLNALIDGQQKKIQTLVDAKEQEIMEV